MELTTRLNTIFLMIGPSECGKTTFAKNYLMEALRRNVPEKNYFMNISYLSSDEIRQELLGHDYDKYANVMLMSSEQAFSLLFEKLKLVTSFPLNADFVVIDSTGLSNEFREQVRAIAAENHYRVEVILFNYKNREDYLHTQRSKSLISKHITRLRREVLPVLRRENYHAIHRVKAPVTELKAEILDYTEMLDTLLTPDKSYTFIGDIHECKDHLIALLKKYQFEFDDEENIIKKPEHDFILLGDFIDKGKNTGEIIEFLYKNKEHFRFVLGNHENFVHKYMENQIQGVDETLLRNYFDSIAIFSLDKGLYDKFAELVALSQPFYRVIGQVQPSFYATHAPCEKKYLGKFDDESKRQMRNFRLIREENVEKQLSFLEKEGNNLHPYHFFGHIAAKSAFRVKNNIHLDTGCVHGGALTGATLNRRLSYLSVSGTKMIDETLPTLFKRKKQVAEADLVPADLKRLTYVAEQKINFISGTIAPAESDVEKNELESLDRALDYFKNKECYEITIQPKYMGSRCNIYLHKQIENSYAVSRNGFKIRDERLQDLFATLKERFHDIFVKNDLTWLILDGELMPWHALGKGLIEEKYIPMSIAQHTEIDQLNHASYDKAFQLAVQKMDSTDFEDDQVKMSKKDLLKKYGSQDYQNFKNILGLKYSYVETEKLKKAADKFDEQINLYGNPEEVTFKAFAILKMVQNNGVERKWEGTTSAMYRLVSEDDFISLDLRQEDAVERAKAYFKTITFDQKMEGIVIKPEKVTKGIAPAMKVRNEDYLHLIYGYDYHFNSKYEKLVRNKKIKQKLRTSIAEYEYGEEMLNIPLAEISPYNESYKEAVMNLLFETTKETEIDPRL
ncbi:metallophosphoesterase [Listeria fleischmannii]|uniref:metallophosphoesterase n=1 Tax=Listeria fleischmannii TaxID=1069827 RepID=UPI0016256ECA|nr:metallophosphoesterase [Listeria fleischmannii]MBC1419657.1 AAA family ATPase [Listeria fleischmannii]